MVNSWWLAGSNFLYGRMKYPMMVTAMVLAFLATPMNHSALWTIYVVSLGTGPRANSVFDPYILNRLVSPNWLPVMRLAVTMAINQYGPTLSIKKSRRQTSSALHWTCSWTWTNPWVAVPWSASKGAQPHRLPIGYPSANRPNLHFVFQQQGLAEVATSGGFCWQQIWNNGWNRLFNS